MFAVVDKDQLETFEDNLDEAGHYEYKTVSAWSDVALPVDPNPVTDDDRSNRWGGGRANRRGGGGMGGGGGGGGGGGAMARLLGLTGQQSEWRIVEIRPEKGR